MKSESKILITKDAMIKSYLPTYGNMYWKTPNIDELAEKGTVFYNHHTGAPSTNMAFMCMSTGEFSYQSEMKDYIISNLTYSGESLFDKAEKLGFTCHIIWNESWFRSSKTVEFYNCYGKNTIFHALPDLKQGVGAHYIHKGFLIPDSKKTVQVYETIENAFKDISNSDDKVFLWIHIPHVINGRTGYGQDIDAFDDIVGIARKYFSDNEIYISADHGNMNGEKGKLCYGFDVYETAVCIPLITPKIQNSSEINYLTCNVDLYPILFESTAPKREIVYCDTTFYAQPNRKLAIVTERYKYIYNKLNRTEELYDLVFDPHENCNIMKDYIYDVDRRVKSPLRELYYYPYWEEAEKQREILKKEKDKIWKNGSLIDEVKGRVKYYLKIYGYYKVKKYVLKNKYLRKIKDYFFSH